MQLVKRAIVAALPAKIFLGNKLILRKDSSFDMLPMKEYMHGRWSYNKETKHLSLSDESAKRHNIVFGVDAVNIYSLHVDTGEFAIKKLAEDHVQDNYIGNYLFHKAYYQFFLRADKDRYPDLSEDIYSKENNWWRIKPQQPESNEQIKKKCLTILPSGNCCFMTQTIKKEIM